MKLATWNINSIRARTDRLIGWLAAEQPDILCLQETKVEDAQFPTAALEKAGYHTVIYGQKSYNGVAIASRQPLTDVTRGLSDDIPDDEARLIAATTFGIRVVCVYVPNGGDLTSDKFPYKLAWYQRLRAFCERAGAQDLVVAGDYNVTADDKDVHAPVKWAGHIHCSEPERAALAEGLGLSVAGGLMQRAERIVLVAGGTLLAAWYGIDDPDTAATIVGATMLLCGVASTGTAINRWITAYRQLVFYAVEAFAGDSTPKP